MKVPLSVMVPTLNEEQNIRKCLASLSFADEVWVVDSSSKDRTVEIAQSMGARVADFNWDGRGPRKKNWALDRLPWKHDWLLIVDADEEVSAGLRDEITAAIDRGQSDAFLVPYHYYFLGRLLRHGAPLWKLILFRRSMARFETVEVPEVTGYDVELHEHPLVSGRTARLHQPMIHHDMADLRHHFQRHNVYSDWEALLRTRYRLRPKAGEIQPRLFGSAMERRRFAKRIFLATPGKPFAYFIYSYVLRGGFLDGRAGFIYNALKAIYWYEVSLKEYEIRLRARKSKSYSKRETARA